MSRVGIFARVSRPVYRAYEGKIVTLKPLDLRHDIKPLYETSHGSPEKEQIWNYLTYGPFRSPDAMRAHYQSFLKKLDMLVYCVHYNEGSGAPIGIVTVTDIDAEHAKAELGHIWYSAQFHRTKVNTESIFLLLKSCFRDFSLRRVAWRCDTNNEKSKNAAQRLGFLPEGIFRQDMISKQRNRDTAWYSIIDSEWPKIEANFEEWLAGRAASLSVLNDQTREAFRTRVTSKL